MAEPAAPASLATWIRSGAVLPDLVSTTAEGLLEELAANLAQALPALSAAAVLEGFREREALGSTALGGGVAIPHCRLPGRGPVRMAVARHPRGLDFAAADGQPVHLFFALAAPQSGAGAHLEALRAVAHYLRDPDRRRALLAAASAAELRALLLEAPAPRPASEVTADV